MKTKDISIIVPIYNAEKFLPEAIESLMNQTFKNIEIILVNGMVKTIPYKQNCFVCEQKMCHCEERSDVAISGLKYTVQLVFTLGIPALRSE